MLDIAEDKNGRAILVDSEIPRAKNLLNVQVGSLHYLPQWGIDLEFFLNPDFSLEIRTFEAYLVQQIASWGMNVTNILGSDKPKTREVRILFDEAKMDNLIRG